MKPDAFMPFYGNDFFVAVEGYPPDIGFYYIKAVWVYWSVNHCRGLPDDDEYLRRVCRVEREDWPRVREILFDNDHFFAQGEDGLWHQKRAFELWQQASANYDKQCARTAAATAARRKSLR